MKLFSLKLAALAIVMPALVTFSLTTTSTAPYAHEVKAGDVTIIHPWVRVMPAAAKVGAGYLTIVNESDKDEHLMSATSPNAELVEIHEMSMENGIMKMRPLANGIVIPAGETIELAPGGFHIMFKKVVTPFTPDAIVPVTLNFMNAGTVQVEFKPGENTGGDDKPMKMNHDNMNHGDSMTHQNEGQTQ